MRARLYFAGVVAAAWMAVPAGASASSNCCFELAVDNQTSYFLDYLYDGFGYDGGYGYRQGWYLRMIVSYSDRGGGKLVQRDGYSYIELHETSTITRCKDSSRPCPDNREPLPCPGADAMFGLLGKDQVSSWVRQAGLTVSRDGLHAAPPDRVYYAVDQLGCNGGHGHPGYGDRAKGVAGDRSVTLRPPRRSFLRTAGRGDRCSVTFRSKLEQGTDHVGSDSAAPHLFESSVEATYRLSYFPRSQLRRRGRALKKLPFGEHFDEWGAHGTGKQRC